MNVASVTDQILEATVVGSFSKLGYAARARLRNWAAPDADLTDRRALVTGSTSGIGRAIADGLAQMGADVVVTSRDRQRADDTAAEISGQSDAGSATGLQLDTSDFDSINAAVTELMLGRRIDIVVHNAGALTDEYQTNDRGMEATLASHLVGPYHLTTELRRQGHLAHGARVLWMSSGGMYTQRLDVENIEMSEDEYRGAVAYAKAKRGQVELVAHLGPKWAPDVIMHSVHPGWVDTPGVEQGLPGFRKITSPILRSAEQGADTMLWLAAGGGDDAEPGSFWHDRATRGTSYLPFTETTEQERQELVEWLDLVTLAGSVG